MFSRFLLLQYLLFMNPQIGLDYDLVMENCFVFNSTSQINSVNRVCHSAVPTVSKIIRIKNYFGDTPFTWVVDATDLETINILEDNGLAFKGAFPAMVLDLNRFDLSQYDDHVSEIDLNNIQGLKTWDAIISQSFGRPAQEFLKAINLFKQKILNNFKLYLGYYYDQPVGAGMVIYHQDVVSLHLIGTLPEFRNKGLGEMITKQMLFDAKKQNYKQAILLASVLGKPLYQKVGFKEYAIYNMYGN